MELERLMMTEKWTIPCLVIGVGNSMDTSTISYVNSFMLDASPSNRNEGSLNFRRLNEDFRALTWPFPFVKVQQAAFYGGNIWPEPPVHLVLHAHTFYLEMGLKTGLSFPFSHPVSTSHLVETGAVYFLQFTIHCHSVLQLIMGNNRAHYTFCHEVCLN